MTNFVCPKCKKISPSVDISLYSLDKRLYKITVCNECGHSENVEFETEKQKTP